MDRVKQSLQNYQADIAYRCITVVGFPVNHPIKRPTGETVIVILVGRLYHFSHTWNTLLAPKMQKTCIGRTRYRHVSLLQIRINFEFVANTHLDYVRTDLRNGNHRTVLNSFITLSITQNRDNPQMKNHRRNIYYQQQNK